MIQTTQYYLPLRFVGRSRLGRQCVLRRTQLSRLFRVTYSTDVAPDRVGRSRDGFECWRDSTNIVNSCGTECVR